MFVVGSTGMVGALVELITCSDGTGMVGALVELITCSETYIDIIKSKEYSQMLSLGLCSRPVASKLYPQVIVIPLPTSQMKYCFRVSIPPGIHCT